MQPNLHESLNLLHVPIKYFEWLVLQYIKHNLPVLDPPQFVYRANCTTEDATSTVLQLAPSHLKNKHLLLALHLPSFKLRLLGMLRQVHLVIHLPVSETAEGQGGQLHIEKC